MHLRWVLPNIFAIRIIIPVDTVNTLHIKIIKENLDIINVDIYIIKVDAQNKVGYLKLLRWWFDFAKKISE